MSSIYKYTSIENAYLTLCNNAVGLNHPQNYNDPFDCAVDIDKKEIEKLVAIIAEYAFSLEILKLLNNKSFKVNLIMRPIIKIDKFIINTNIKLAAKEKYYEPIPLFYWIVKLGIKYIAKKNNIFINEMKESLYNEIISKVREERDSLLISCFGKRWNSILMWAHYGDKHRGICIEYERPKNDFIDVKYSKKRCKFDMVNITRKIIGYKLAEEEFNLNEKRMINYLIEPFIVKAIVWKYEEEVRCIFSKNTEGVYIDEKGNALFKMPTNIKKVYIGCKVDKNSVTLIKLLSQTNKQNIPVVFLKASDRHFRLEEIID